MISDQNLIPHLFRQESSKITAVLCKLLGVANIDVAQDIAAETFLSALEIWPYKGLPPNPAAWLYTTAKNKAKNYIHRNNLFAGKIAPDLKHLTPTSSEIEIDMTEENITDSQLQMLFAICHPSISAEAQIGLALRILCGFGIEEIATAFLSNKETINKRLSRAKENLRKNNVQIEFPASAEINNRLENVLTTLYLLFNEGYYSESSDAVIREDLCIEALRLTHLLAANEQTAQPKVKALLALMCFHASRLAARKNENNEAVLYADQDENLWNKELIARGFHYLNEASKGTDISKYHLEASIAYWHTVKADTTEKWENILQLYNRLLQIEYSPVAALNRTFALSKTKGKKAAVKEAEKLQLNNNHYYFTLLGELYTDIDNAKAIKNLHQALMLAKTQTDKNTIRKKLETLEA